MTGRSQSRQGERRSWHQRLQDGVERRGHKKLARRIFMLRVRVLISLGRVRGVRIVREDKD